MEIFERQLDKKGDNFVIDGHVPKDGTYIIVRKKNGELQVDENSIVDIKMDKKTGNIIGDDSHSFHLLRQLDYHCQLIDMNKPIDPKKVIHSNNYLSFFIKKESLTSGKLTEAVIRNYYEILKEPRIKYKKVALPLYEAIEEEVGKVPLDEVDDIQLWMEQNLFDLGAYPLHLEGKDYLKIFFCLDSNNEETIARYEKEGKRYILPNIYNSNDFNTEIDGVIYGLSNDNMNLNSKKPFLEHKTRKSKVPYLVSNEDILIQKKFFDFLMNKASSGQYNIYFDTEYGEVKGYRDGDYPDAAFEGAYLRIRKAKVVEIVRYEPYIVYQPKLMKKFSYQMLLSATMKEDIVKSANYGTLWKTRDLEEVIHDILFSKFLKTNYFLDIQDISIKDQTLEYMVTTGREGIYNWLFQGSVKGIKPLLMKLCQMAIYNSLNKGYYLKATHQWNLKYSLKEYFEGEESMQEADMMKGTLLNYEDHLRKMINDPEKQETFENDGEFYYAVGQITYYLLQQNKGSSKKQALANPFFKAGNVDVIKRLLKSLYLKYNFDINFSNKRFDRLYSEIILYQPAGKINQELVIAGFLSDSLIYEKTKEEEGNE